MDDHIFKHYEASLGRPSSRRVFQAGSDPEIEVLQWFEPKGEPGMFLFATVGASRRLRSSHDSCEFFIELSSAVAIETSLLGAADEGVGTGRPPSYGSTLTFDDPLWPGTGMTTLLFSDVGAEFIPPLVDVVPHVHFVRLIPLYESELAYKTSRGYDALQSSYRC